MAISDIDLKKASTELDFQIGKTSFTITKMGAMSAWRLLEQIREKLGQTELDSYTGESQGFLQTVIGLDSSFVDRIREELFGYVYFTNDSARTQQKVVGAEDMAFMGLEPSAIYEVLLRSLAVNFMPSLIEAGFLRTGAEALTTMNP